ncbi:hypothetical protein [Thermococcus prieurii]
MLEVLRRAWRDGFERGKKLAMKRRRRGSLDPRIGMALAATFIGGFIALLVVAQVQPQVDQSIPANSTLYTSYQTFTGYVGKSFSMWGLAIFIGVLGMVVGAIYGFLGRG